jgi:riboflavin kinase/FMN adenylyltransferase
VTALIVPPSGVYAVHCAVSGKSHRAVLNIGYRPTLRSSAPELRVEAHLLEFNADLYGQEVEITFVEKLRSEQKFPSLDHLREQITRDIQAARSLFGNQC